jgi:penicillin G amidase
VRRAVARALKGLGLAAALAAAALAWTVLSTRPRLAGRQPLAGLHASVTVIRDTWGIPHVFSENERDLFAAIGYVQAQDRLWQMEMMRRMAEGRVAELFGREAVPTDLFARTLDLAGAAEKAWSALGEAERGQLTAYAEGVNAYRRTGRLPLEFRLLVHRPEPWRPQQSIYPHLLAAYLYSHNLNEELFFARVAPRVGKTLAAELLPTAGRRLARTELAALPDYAGLRVAEMPRLWPGSAAAAEASNAWVVDGSRSASGKPLLAGDPHTYFYQPSIVYEMGVHGGGRDVAGYFTAGSPYAVIGRNARIAWTAAAVEADLIDVFIERLTPDGTACVEGDRAQPLERREIEIRVRGGKPLRRAVRFSPRGPLLNDLTRPEAANRLPYPVVPYDGGHGLALSWAAARFVDESVTAYSRLNRAADWSDFRDAVRHLTGISFHFLYADREGNVGWQMTGRLPVRKKGSGKYPVPAWTGEYGWTGFVPFDELPHALNPPSHAIVAANQDLRPAGYPHPVSNSWFGPYRARRIEQLLAAREKVTTEDFRRMQLDRVSAVGQRLQSLLATLDSPDPRVARALERLRRWDGDMRPDSSEAALAGQVLEALWPRLFRPLLGPDWVHLRLAADGHYNVLESMLDDPSAALWNEAERASGSRSREEILLGAVADAVARIERRQGGDPDAWRWGAENRLTLVHQPFGLIKPLHLFFSRGPYEVGGDGNTLNVSRVDPYSRSPRIGAVYRLIVDMADPDAAIAMGSSGESGDPLSPHYDDMIRASLRGTYHALPFTEAAVRARAEAVLELAP